MGTIIKLGLYKIIFRPLRASLGIFTVVMRKPKQHRNIVRFFQACCCSCLHLYERALRYQSKHALVQTIMWSESYRTSSKRAWFLLFRHRSRITNLDSLVTFILFLTKVFVYSWHLSDPLLDSLLFVCRLDRPYLHFGYPSHYHRNQN